MKSIFKPNALSIIELFRNNGNEPLHLRELARGIHLSPGPTSRIVRILLKDKVLVAEMEANLKKIHVDERVARKLFMLLE